MLLFWIIFVTKNQLLFTSKISSIRVFFIKEPEHILFLIKVIKELQSYPRLLGTEFDFVKPSGSLRYFIRIEVLKILKIKNILRINPRPKVGKGYNLYVANL